MKKKIICVAGILGAVLTICVVLYFAVIHPHAEMYVYCVEFYNPENLNLSYTAILKTKTPQTAYAVINSITFGE